MADKLLIHEFEEDLKKHRDLVKKVLFGYYVNPTLGEMREIWRSEMMNTIVPTPVDVYRGMVREYVNRTYRGVSRFGFLLEEIPENRNRLHRTVAFYNLDHNTIVFDPNQFPPLESIFKIVLEHEAAHAEDAELLRRLQEMDETNPLRFSLRQFSEALAVLKEIEKAKLNPVSWAKRLAFAMYQLIHVPSQWDVYGRAAVYKFMVTNLLRDLDRAKSDERKQRELDVHMRQIFQGIDSHDELHAAFSYFYLPLTIHRELSKTGESPREYLKTLLQRAAEGDTDAKMKLYELYLKGLNEFMDTLIRHRRIYESISSPTRENIEWERSIERAAEKALLGYETGTKEIVKLLNSKLDSALKSLPPGVSKHYVGSLYLRKVLGIISSKRHELEEREEENISQVELRRRHRAIEKEVRFSGLWKILESL